MSDIDHGAGFYETSIGETLKAARAQKNKNVFAALDGLCEVVACTCRQTSKTTHIEPDGGTQPPS